MRKEFFLPYNEKINIHGYIWQEEVKTKGTIQIAHGMAEHILRYDEFATFLATQGFTVIGHDHIAHGLTASSFDKIGIIEDGDFMNEILNGMKKVRDSYQNLFSNNTILFAHSMGSMAAQRYVELYPNDFDKLVLSGTDFGGTLYKFAKMSAGSYQKKHGKNSYSNFIQKVSIDSFNKRFVKDDPCVGWLSSNQINNELYKADPMCGMKFPVHYFYSLAINMLEANKNENLRLINPNLHILLIAGEDDPVGGYAKRVRKVYQRYKELNINTNISIYHHARHELLNEVEKTKHQVYEDILAFCLDN